MVRLPSYTFDVDAISAIPGSTQSRFFVAVGTKVNARDPELVLPHCQLSLSQLASSARLPRPPWTCITQIAARLAHAESLANAGNDASESASRRNFLGTSSIPLGATEGRPRRDFEELRRFAPTLPVPLEIRAAWSRSACGKSGRSGTDRRTRDRRRSRGSAGW